MASSSCRWKADNHLRVTSDNPHFFKVILAHSLNEQRLNIPRKFVREHGKALRNKKVCLKVSGGAEWNVGLTKSNGQIWFQNGWQDFVEFYSVKLGYFLIFRYEGNSCFHVVIFDYSVSEIQYPVKEKKVMFKSENIEEFEDDDDSVQILDHKTQADSCFMPSKKIKTNQTFFTTTSKPEGFTSKELKKEKMAGNEDTPFSTKEFKDFKVGDGFNAVETKSSEHYGKKLMKPLIATRRARVIEKATIFKSTIANPSFMVAMTASYIHGKPLNIPKSFVDMHLKVSTDIIIQVSDERIWSLRYFVRCARRNRKIAELRNGWKTFVQDSDLKLGDVCVFEMIGSTKKSFKVHIFRILENEVN